MPQCQFLFSAVFVFQKSCTGNILGITQDKIPGPYFFVTRPESEGESKGGLRVARHVPGAASPGPTLGMCLGLPGLCRLRPLAYLFSISENPKYPIRNPRKVPTPPSSPNPSRGV